MKKNAEWYKVHTVMKRYIIASSCNLQKKYNGNVTFPPNSTIQKELYLQKVYYIKPYTGSYEPLYP